MTKVLKIEVTAFGKIWKFPANKYCGYIICDRLRKVQPISHDAIPLHTEKGDSFMCDCGLYTSDDVWYHRLFYKGKEIKYGY